MILSKEDLANLDTKEIQLQDELASLLREGRHKSKEYDKKRIQLAIVQHKRYR